MTCLTAILGASMYSCSCFPGKTVANLDWAMIPQEESYPGKTSKSVFGYLTLGYLSVEWQVLPHKQP